MAFEDAPWRRKLMRSGMVTALVIACVLIGLTVAYRAHMQGNFHKLKLKANIESERQEAPVPRPGGQEPIVLQRSRMAGDAMPEFLSATLLPGRGMNVLQITAYIPGKGEINLLASPSVQAAAARMTGHGADAHGEASLAMGGAFEVPWADRLGGGTPDRNGVVTTTWQGHALSAPAGARDGWLLAQAADTATSETLPDGADAQAVFHEADFGGRWISKTDVTVSALLSSQAVELTVVATNVGDVAEPIGVGWHPRFAIAPGGRAQMRLRIPAESRLESRDRTRDQPGGTPAAPAGSEFDFSAPDGASLGTRSVDDCFIGLKQKLLDSGPAVELSDPSSGYGLRITALSPAIRTVCAVAPTDGNFVSINPQYNYPDPFGKQWSGETNAGMVTLEPGQSTEWKIRLELFVLSGSAAAN
ncbi:MAG TPA: aldose 1-epimerase [Acidobacteriaceae bacterium]|nr:aldose 1-epimerase [Acidobacteriaceae bacterium]